MPDADLGGAQDPAGAELPAGAAQVEASAGEAVQEEIGVHGAAVLRDRGAGRGGGVLPELRARRGGRRRRPHDKEEVRL